MACEKCKSWDDNNWLLSDCQKLAQVALDGSILMQR